MDSTVFMYGVVVLGWALGGIIGGATGLGAVMVSMPILTVVLDPGDAVLVSCIISIYVYAHLAYTYRKFCLWSDLKDLVIGIIPGSVIGVMVLKAVPIQALQLMISLMLISFVLLQLFRKVTTYLLPKSTPVGIATGMVCGFVNTSVAMMGAPLGAYVLLRHWDPDRARGNMSALFAIGAVGAVAMQATAGLYNIHLLQISVFGIAGGALGQVVGVRLGRNMDQQRLNRIILVFLSLVAIMLGVQALR